MKHKKVLVLFLNAIRKTFLGFALAAGVLTACVDQTVQLPDGYIPQEKMVDIMVDIHLVEGARSGTLLLGDTNKLPDYYAHIYEKYDITEEQFKTSFDWYSQHPVQLKAVYDEVIVELSKLEEEIRVKKKD